jgi:hypothetical protein
VKDVCAQLESGFPPMLGNPGFRPPWPFVYTTPFIRFANPNATDAANAISFRNRVWDSLDEGRDYTSMTSPATYIDLDNPSCGGFYGSDQVLAGDFTGYVTVDVTNFCTNLFPSDPQFYVRDAIATAGWHQSTSTVAVGPNVLMGDYFYVDPANPGGNISGDSAIALEFDSRLDWFDDTTFYDRYYTSLDVANAGSGVYSFIGDGREPLGRSYGFRYLSDTASGSQTWATVWRSDIFGYDADGEEDYAGITHLCRWGYFWMLYLTGGEHDGTPVDDPYLWIYGFDAAPIGASLWDEDEHSLVSSGGGPSGDPVRTTSLYVFVESQRIRVSAVAALNPQGYKFGWTRWTLTSLGLGQGWIGVQHSSEGQFVSVGHNATALVNDFTCPGDVFGALPGNNAVAGAADGE